MRKINQLLPLILIIAVAMFSISTAYAKSANKEIVSMKKHIEQGVTCENCHGVANPTKAAMQDGCLLCHANSDGTYRGELDKSGVGIEKEYPESGKTKMASIHDSHGGKIRCTVCHTSHKLPEKLYCNNCHQFNIKIK